jgi:hypothetical protein
MFFVLFRFVSPTKSMAAMAAHRQEDREVVETAVRRNGCSLRYAAQTLREVAGTSTGASASLKTPNSPTLSVEGLKSNAGLRSNVWGSRFFSGDKDGQKRRKCLGQAAFFLGGFCIQNAGPYQPVDLEFLRWNGGGEMGTWQE